MMIALIFVHFIDIEKYDDSNNSVTILSISILSLFIGGNWSICSAYFNQSFAIVVHALNCIDSISE